MTYSNVNLNNVCIFIPTYNRGNVIRDTLESLINQTISNFDIIVVDNCSTDNTEEIVYSLDNSRISYHKNHENLGAIGNFNCCIDIAISKKYQFMGIFHSEDIYYNSIVESEINELRNDEKIGATFSKMQSLNSKNLMNKNDLSSELVTKYDFESFIKVLLEKGTPFFCPTFMCKVSIFEKTGKFSEAFKYFGDTEFYMRILKHYKIALINQTLGYYRISVNQESYIQKSNLVWLTEEHIFLEKFINDNYNNLPVDLVNSYKLRVSKEYIIYAVEGVRNRIVKDKIMRYVEISVKFHKFNKLNKFTFVQYLLLHRRFRFINSYLLVTKFLKSKKMRNRP